MSRMPMIGDPRTDLLRKLAQHLDTGELGHEKFYFGFFNSGPSPRKRSHYQDEPRLRRCNSAGCGLGECPFVFPEWHFNNEEQPVYRDIVSSEISAGIFFDLDRIQYEHLFIPDRQIPYEYGGKTLTKYCTKEELAANIRIFCDFIDKENGK